MSTAQDNHSTTPGLSVTPNHDGGFDITLPTGETVYAFNIDGNWEVHTEDGTTYELRDLTETEANEIITDGGIAYQFHGDWYTFGEVKHN